MQDNCPTLVIRLVSWLMREEKGSHAKQSASGSNQAEEGGKVIWSLCGAPVLFSTLGGAVSTTIRSRLQGFSKPQASPIRTVWLSSAYQSPGPRRNPWLVWTKHSNPAFLGQQIISFSKSCDLFWGLLFFQKTFVLMCDRPVQNHACRECTATCISISWNTFI